MLTAIVGINWGDEGKGRMVDLLSSDYDVVVRYQGGNNAGHTVINSLGKFVLNLLPSGILRDDVVNVMGNGMAIDLKHLCGEIDKLKEAGIQISPKNLKISDRAIICMPFHIMQDVLEEERLKDKKFGSTRRGIAPVYGDKYLKKAIRMGELCDLPNLLDRVEGLVEWKNLTINKAYGNSPIDFSSVKAYLKDYAKILTPYITDTGLYLNDLAKFNKKIMFEAQLGALRDIDFGIYPYTSSSSTIAAYAPIGAGVPNLKLDKVIGIMKAYSTCVGEGPFVAEYKGEDADFLRKQGNEFGAATGRPRRVGPFDVVASKYGIRAQGADEIALTKLDVLSGLKEVEICTHYEYDGEKVEEFPFSSKLEGCKPVYIKMPGWEEDITNCKTFNELPNAAKKYINFIEQATKCPISYISVGPERSQYIKI